MPSARHTTAAATSAGLRAKVRSSYRRSWSMRLVGSGLRLVHDAAVEQVDRSIGVLRVARIVRHHAHRRAAAVQRPQQVHHRLAVTGVEIPRGLVGEQDRGIAHHRARDRDSLLLAPGELHRVMLRAMHHADPLERLLHALGALRPRHATVGERQLDILGDGEIADQIEGLEHEADPPVADSGSLGRRQVSHRLVLEQVAPVARRIEQTENREERRLAASRRAVDRDVLALTDLEVHVRQRVGLDLVGEEDLSDAVELHVRRTIPWHRISSLSCVRCRLPGVRVADTRHLTPDTYFSLTRSTLSYRDMADRITESPAASPCTISIALTEVRPTFTGMCTA